ncbi:GNAT family N-acetyltransferase [Listeria floridensis]|nr:GNAT family N-acetyltransferase [Listeria floridensis]
MNVELEKEIKFKFVERDDSKLAELKRLYMGAFPAEERAPFWFLLWKARDGNVDFYSLYEDKSWIGLLYLVHHKDITFIFYFAIDHKFQSSGYGGRILAKLSELFPEKRLILTIEEVNPTAANNEQREKRKQFYFKHGFTECDYRLCERGIVYEMLAKGGFVTSDEYTELMKVFLGKWLFWLFKPEILTD